MPTRLELANHRARSLAFRRSATSRGRKQLSQNGDLQMRRAAASSLSTRSKSRKKILRVFSVWFRCWVPCKYRDSIWLRTWRLWTAALCSRKFLERLVRTVICKSVELVTKQVYYSTCSSRHGQGGLGDRNNHHEVSWITIPSLKTLLFSTGIFLHSVRL